MYWDWSFHELGISLSIKSKSAAEVAYIILVLIDSYGPPQKMIMDQSCEFINQVRRARTEYNALCGGRRRGQEKNKYILTIFI